MARKTIKQRIALDGGKEVESQLKQMGEAGEKAFDRIRNAAAQASLAKFGQSLDTFVGSLQTAGKRMALAFAGATTVITAAAAGITSLAKSGADAADEAGKAAQAAGLQIDAYGRLSFAAEQAGVSGEQFGAAMSRLNREIGEAATGGKDAQAKFSALGVSIRDVQGRLRPTEAIVQDLAEAFSRMPDGARKSALAIDLLGKSGAQLLPFLNSGKQGLIDLGAMAERLGIVFTAEQAKIAEAMNDTLDQVSAATSGIKLQLGLLFAPVITAAAERLRDTLIANREAILGFARSLADTALPIIEDFISALAGDDRDVQNVWILEWRDAIVAFGNSAKVAFTDIVIPALSFFKKALDTAAEALRIFTGIDVDGTTLAIAIAVGQASGAFRVLYAAIGVVIAGLRTLVAHPVIAAITAIGSGIALWAASTDTATAAMRVHEGVVGRIEEAYRKAGFEVAKMTREVRDRLLLETRNALQGTEEALSSAMSKLTSQLMILRQQEGIGPIVEQFINGKKTVEEFTAAVTKFGLNNPELAQDAQTILDWAKNVEELSRKSREGKDQIALLEGRMSDAAFRAKYFADQQQAVATSSAQASQQVAETTKKVEELGKTITVHSSDGGKPVQKVFDLIDGTARAAEESKSSLDEVSASADATAQKIGQVKDDVSGLIVSVPEELKGKPTVADALTTGLTEVPAAAKAAADGVIAEVSKVPQAVSTALAGGVKQGEEQGAAVSGIADTLAQPFELARDRIAAALAAVPPAVAGALTTVQTSAAEMGVVLGDQLVGPFDAAATRIAQILERMTAAVRSQFDAMLGTVRSMTTQLQSAVATLEALAARAEAAAARARAAQASSAGGLAGGGLAQPFANGGQARRYDGGGRVSGPGTGTSDSILARLSNGEFVMRFAAVKKYGLDLLYALNGLRLPKNFFKGFADGGAVGLSRIVSGLTTGMQVPRLVPAFADGGAVPASSGRPVNLTIDGQTYQMMAPDEVADRLAKHQGRQGLKKAGKKPSWR
ncbi:hypothetical protein V3589_02510 [Sinorhizobium fredii]|uniref:phage tail tape measure protein n=1 Tax=Rhizobium fredii TaxID=380 RepID=UPI0030ADB06F